MDEAADGSRAVGIRTQALRSSLGSFDWPFQRRRRGEARAGLKVAARLVRYMVIQQISVMVWVLVKYKS
jgi:hypothetical protein